MIYIGYLSSSSLGVRTSSIFRIIRTTCTSPIVPYQFCILNRYFSLVSQSDSNELVSAFGPISASRIYASQFSGTSPSSYRETPRKRARRTWVAREICCCLLCSVSQTFCVFMSANSHPPSSSTPIQRREEGKEPLVPVKLQSTPRRGFFWATCWACQYILVGAFSKAILGPRTLVPSQGRNLLAEGSLERNNILPKPI